MIGLTAEIALEGASAAFDRLYTYSVPQTCENAAAGCRVTVPFGAGNVKKQGMIFAVKTGETEGLKSITALIDKTPVLSEELVGLCRYLHDTTFCTYYDAVRVMLPAGINYKLINTFAANEDFSSPALLTETEQKIYSYLCKKGETAEAKLTRELGVSAEALAELLCKQAVFKTRDIKRRANDATEKWVRLSSDFDESDGLRLTPRQREITDFVSGTGGACVKEIRYFTGVSPSVIEGLLKKGVLESFQKRVFRTATKPVNAAPEEITLNTEQQAAFEGLLAEYRKPSGATALLYGVTGAGKTQVFLKLVDEVVRAGHGVIVMVPEIALTPQMLSIFTGRYGDRVAVFHSAMSVGKRMDEWERIRCGKAQIALGTRSAVFAPFSDLGLIILDEEQEHTYKSEQSPRFHAREVAKYRTAYGGGLLCLASATPSVESFTAASAGKYALFRLTKRYGNAQLPQVETVDMRQEILSGNTGLVSRRLYEAVTDTLAQKKQVILLLNRRGHNTYISCPSCGSVMTCPNCSISLTYHSANHRLMCHYCGYSVKAEDKCPVCGGEHMKFLGAGTQKAEEELHALFPEARILRVDADSTMARESYAAYLEAFAAGEYDILLGTQMVAKGLDFPNVTLVGVLGADSAMYSEDFRSFERSFSLLTQVVGRAGRGGAAGTAIIQSMNPESNIISLAAKQDYEGFYREEIANRKLMIYPPYCDICVVSARASARETAQQAVNAVFDRIKELLNGEYGDMKVIILGPAPASVPRVNHKYRYRMIIKCKNSRRFREMLRTALAVRLRGDASVMADMNPETIL